MILRLLIPHKNQKRFLLSPVYKHFKGIFAQTRNKKGTHWRKPATLHSFFLKQTCLKNESAKLLTLRAHVPTCLACLSAHVLTCLTCLRPRMPCVLMCSGANSLACLRAHVPCVLTCQSALRTYLLTCQCAFRAHILFLACLRANLSCVPSCLRVQTKTSFQWHVFLRFEIKLYMKSAQAGMYREVSRIWMQFPFFANTLFWASDDNLWLKHPANCCNRVAFAAGVQKKPKRCKALKVAKRP